VTALADLLLEEVRAMRRELAEFRAEARAHAPHRGDPLMSVLLPAIVGAIGDRVFSLVDLAAMGTLPGNEALARSLAPLLGTAGGLRSLGRRFARCVGQNINGHTLLRVGDCRDGGLWQVRVSTRELAPPIAPFARERDAVRTFNLRKIN